MSIWYKNTETPCENAIILGKVDQNEFALGEYARKELMDGTGTFYRIFELEKWAYVDELARCDDDIKQLHKLVDNQHAEINRLRKALAQIINDAEYGEFIDLDSAKKALNGESEEE